MKPVPKHVRIVPALMHINYEVNGRYFDARVRGVTTTVIAGRFRGGETPDEIARDYEFSLPQREGSR